MRLTQTAETLGTLRYWSGSQKAYPSCLRTRKGSRTTTSASLCASSYTSLNGRLWFFSSALYSNQRYATFWQSREMAHTAVTLVLTRHPTGPFLRLSLRAIMHDAICSYFSDTRPYSPSTGLCRSQVQLVRGELCHAHFPKDF